MLASSGGGPGPRPAGVGGPWPAVKVLNQLAADELPRSWRRRTPALRADLMLFLDLVPFDLAAARIVRQWSDLLPAQSAAGKRLRTRRVARRRGGHAAAVRLAASAFVNRHRERVAHELLSSVLAWWAERF